MDSKKTTPNNALGINTDTKILRAEKDMVCELGDCKNKIPKNSLYMQHDYTQSILNLKVENTICKECAKLILTGRMKKIHALYKELTEDFIAEIQISFLPDDDTDDEEDNDIGDEPRNSDDDYMDYINKEIQMMQNRA